MQNLHSWLMYQVHGVRLPRQRRQRRRGPDQAEDYRDWVRQQPSAVSESTRAIEACHTGPHGFWQKSSGYTCIPLTHEEHMELQRIGPRKFQEKYRIDFEVIIEGLFTEWSEIQARRSGQDVAAVERKTSEAGALDAA
jgi:hypothetical protein